MGAPPRTLDRDQRKSRLARQSPRHRRRGMDKLGAPLRCVSKLVGGQRVDASTAPISGFEDGDLLSGACKLTSGHQACGACTDDQAMVQ
jgi:hypothetical protein